jgi:RNA polymerase sigma factor (sigma-70 family)
VRGPHFGQQPNAPVVAIGLCRSPAGTILSANHCKSAFSSRQGDCPLLTHTNGPERDQEPAIVDLIPALRAFARTFCRDPSDADDLVQETLTKGIANIDKFEAGTRMKSWLFTIMRNTFLTAMKSYSREAPGLLDCASGRPTTEATQEWSVRGKEVHAAINRLPESHREILVLVGVLGMNYDEAAAICGCAVGTVKSRLHRARLKVLADLGEPSSETLFESTTKFRSRLLPDTRTR